MSDPRAQFGPKAEAYFKSASHANVAELSSLVRLARPAGGRILDVGTGAGHTAYAFALGSSEVVATDITPEMLAIVDREAAVRGLNIRTQLCPAEDLPFPDRSFEGVTSRTAAHHFRDVRAFLAEAFRVLQPKGWLLVADTVGIEDDPLADEELDRIEVARDPSHVRNYTPSRWRAMIEEAGFVVEHQEVVARTHPVDEWLDRMEVQEPTRSKVRQAIEHSEDGLRAYLRPRHEPELVFDLWQTFVLARKPS